MFTRFRQSSLAACAAVCAALALIFASAYPALAETVTAGPGETPAHTVTVPAGEDTPLKSYDPETGTLVLDKAWAQPLGLNEDTVLAIARTAGLPDGAMRWIEGIEDTGDTVTVTTRPARLTEALAGVPKEVRAAAAEGPIEAEGQGVEAELADADTAEETLAHNPEASETSEDVTPIADASGEPEQEKPAKKKLGIHVNKPFGKDFTLAFDKVITQDSCTDGTFGEENPPTECEWEGDGTLHVDLALKVAANGALVIETNGLKIDEISLTGGADITGDTKLDTSGPIRGHATWRLADLNFPLVVPVGPVPIPMNVRVQPDVTVTVDADGTAHATISGLNASYRDMGLRFSSKGGVAKEGAGGFEFLKGTPSVGSLAPTMEGKADLHSDVGINPNLSIDMLGMLGVKVNVGAHANTDFRIDPTNPICMLGLGMQGDIALADFNAKKVPVIGWMLGGLEKKINAAIAKNATYHWDEPRMYTSPNLCSAHPISIGDRVWIDLDGNGIQDDGEPGLEGARVQLLRGATADLPEDTSSPEYAKIVVAEATTDAEGAYRFDADPAYPGDANGANAGKLMPGAYTVVVTPPTPEDDDYAYGESSATPYPYGFVAPKRYATIDPKAKTHTLADLQRDSGGKYAWNKQSYSGYFDGSRYQDSTVARAGEKETSTSEAFDALSEEIAQTNGYNDTVDFGFVPSLDPQAETYRVSGKVYVADGQPSAAPEPLAPEAEIGLLPGIHEGNIRGAKPASWVRGAKIRLTPKPGTLAHTSEVTTDAAGRFTTKLPEGSYSVELVSLPSGYERIEGATYAGTFVLDEDSAASLVIPGETWVNFGVSNAPNRLGTVAFVDSNDNGQPDEGEAPVEGVGVSITHIARTLAEAHTDNTGLASLQFANTSGVIATKLTAQAPEGRQFSAGAVDALGEGACELSEDQRTLTCDISAADGVITMNATQSRLGADAMLRLPLVATEEEQPTPEPSPEESTDPEATPDPNETPAPDPDPSVTPLDPDETVEPEPTQPQDPTPTQPQDPDPIEAEKVTGSVAVYPSPHVRGDATVYPSPHAKGSAKTYPPAHAAGRAQVFAPPHAAGSAQAFAPAHARGEARAYSPATARGEARAAVPMRIAATEASPALPAVLARALDTRALSANGEYIVGIADPGLPELNGYGDDSPAEGIIMLDAQPPSEIRPAATGATPTPIAPPTQNVPEASPSPKPARKEAAQESQPQPQARPLASEAPRDLVVTPKERTATDTTEPSTAPSTPSEPTPSTRADASTREPATSPSTPSTRATTPAPTHSEGADISSPRPQARLIEQAPTPTKGGPLTGAWHDTNAGEAPARATTASSAPLARTGVAVCALVALAGTFLALGYALKRMRRA